MDGKKDATTIIAEANGKYQYNRQTTFEQHYLIVGEPSGTWLSHLVREDETGENVTRSIHTAIKYTPLERKLKIIRSDGTAVMIDINSSYTASLEASVGRPLQ